MTSTQVAQSVNKTLEQAGLPTLTTANLMAVPRSPQAFAKLQQAENAKTLMDWKEGINHLSIERPAEWTSHLATLKTMPLLKRDGMMSQFEHIKQQALAYGIDFDSAKKEFYLLPVPELTGEAADRLARQLYPERYS